VRFPIANQFWGARYGQLNDPFGHVWSIGGPAKE
jgi:PhnB protein